MQAILVSFFTCFIVIFSYNIFPSLGYLLEDVAINCGCVSNSTALDSRHWVGETTPLLQPNGKSRSSTSSHKLFSDVSADPTPYFTARISFSYFSYLFQVNPGQKFVRFHFYPEIYQGFENYQDLFTVEANSFTLVHNFSASLAAHALGVKYLVKEYCLNVNETGILHISFLPLQNSDPTNNFFAFVNGIEIISMPTGLYYTPEDSSLGPRIVGQSNRFYDIDNSTALELVQRLNIGGASISPVEDTGMFRRWTGDVGLNDINYLFPAIEYAISPPYVAPPKIYLTSRKLIKNFPSVSQFTWKISVDVGFSYLLRLHFSFFGIELLEGGMEEFDILIQNHVAEAQINVIQLSGGKRTPVYRDYLVMVKGHRARGKRDLCVSLQPFHKSVLGLLNGLEIFKLSNTDDNLASPNPSSPRHTSSSWTLKMHSVLLAFGWSNVIVTALTIFLALVNLGVYQLRQINGYTFQQERNLDLAPDEPTFRRFSLTEILLATQDFNEALVIGKGGFGKVYKGFIHGCPESLAIKRLKPDSNQGASEFWREIETLSKLRHVHLVSLLGYCLEKEEMILVYEYMPRGTVADNLYKSGTDGKENNDLNWEQRLRICIGAARGLDYLHTGTQHGIIHRDVKDTNILLDENLVPKISDFGLSKLRKIGETQDDASTKVKGTFGYLDPDYITTHKPSTKSDVYAFGIVMLVVLSGRRAVDTRIFGEMKKGLVHCFHQCMKKGEMSEIIDPSLQGYISAESLTRFTEAIGNCLRRRPKKRHTMAQLVLHLENALEVQLQIGAVPSSLGADTIVDLSSPAGSNRSFEFFEFKDVPIPEESVSRPKLGNNSSKAIEKTDLQSKGNDGLITRKLLRGRPWYSLKNILKPSKKMNPALQAAAMLREWKHPIRMFSLKDIKLATEDFSPKLISGKGSLGTVYKGLFNNGIGIVAIKKFWSNRLEVNGEFQAQVELLSTIRNVHLVPFVGLCIESDEVIIVYEYMSDGTLRDHLYGNNGRLSWEQRLKICTGAARGLNYLHEVGVIYRDLNTNNIMLEENFVAKISDYGLSKLFNRQIYGRASLDYLDPVYLVSGRLTKASDVYSFGIVLLVVLSGRPAFDYERPEKHQLVYSWYKTCSQRGNFDELIDPNLVGRIPSASLGKFMHLIKSCLHENPEHRPVMAQVVVNLEEALHLLGKEEREAHSAVRLRDLHTLKGHVENVMKLKSMDIDTMKQNYTI